MDQFLHDLSTDLNKTLDFIYSEYGTDSQIYMRVAEILEDVWDMQYKRIKTDDTENE